MRKKGNARHEDKKKVSMREKLVVLIQHTIICMWVRATEEKNSWMGNVDEEWEVKIKMVDEWNFFSMNEILRCELFAGRAFFWGTEIFLNFFGQF